MEVSGQLQASAALTWAKQPPVHILTEDWVDPRAGTDVTKKKKSLTPTGNRTPTPRSSIL
jgi:hypothetical protein